MKSPIAKIAVVLFCLLLLSACGKKGPVRPVDSVASGQTTGKLL